MPNTWNGMIAENIAQEGISTLEKSLIPLAGFTLDYSTDVAAQGTVVNTRIVPAATASTDIDSDESGDYSGVGADVTTTNVPVTLNRHPGTGFFLTDKEAQEIGAGVWADTSRRLVRSNARGIAEDVLDDAFSLVTTANYGAAALTESAANFDSDNVADLRTVCVNAGLDVEEMILVLNPSYHTALLKDAGIKDFSASQSDALRTGTLPRISGFRVVEAPTLPANGENLVGFAAHPQAMAIAMRAVQSQDPSAYLSYQTLMDDATGAVMTYSANYLKETKRQVQHVFEAMFGVAKADGAALKRIVSA